MKNQKQESDAVALQKWVQYCNDKVPMLIREKPTNFECDGNFIVVPQTAKNFVMASFSTIDAANDWCVKQGFPKEVLA